MRQDKNRDSNNNRCIYNESYVLYHGTDCRSCNCKCRICGCKDSRGKGSYSVFGNAVGRHNTVTPVDNAKITELETALGNVKEMDALRSE